MAFPGGDHGHDFRIKLVIPYHGPIGRRALLLPSKGNRSQTPSDRPHARWPNEVRREKTCGDRLPFGEPGRSYDIDCILPGR